MSGGGPILFFDGVCNVCDASVRFVLDHETAPVLRFASLQSKHASEVLPPHGVSPADLDSMVILDGDRVYTRSTAVLQTTKYMKAPWKWLSIFLWVPRPVRDFFYLAFAKYRYRLFGHKDECAIPTPALRARFLT